MFEKKTSEAQIGNATGQGGKARSARTAGRHHQTEMVFVMTVPEREVHMKFTKEYVADLAPVGKVEEDLAHELAFDAWRLNRIHSIETNSPSTSSASTGTSTGT